MRPVCFPGSIKSEAVTHKLVTVGTRIPPLSLKMFKARLKVTTSEEKGLENMSF